MLRWCQSTVRALDGYGITTSTGILIPAKRYEKFVLHRGQLTHRFTLNSFHTNTAGRAQIFTQARGPILPGHTQSHGCNTKKSVTQGAGARRNTSIPHSVGISPNAPTIYALPSVPDTSDAATTLIKFLSTPYKLSAHTLKSLYASTKASGHLQRLTPKHLTDLISLLGALSISPDRSPRMYASRHLSFVLADEEPLPIRKRRVYEAETRTEVHWPFVLEVVRDKEKLLGQSLNGTDRYWLMRALLVQLVSPESPKVEPGTPHPLQLTTSSLMDVRFPTDHRLLARATQQYLRIWRHTSDPDVHLPFLHALLALSEPEHFHSLVHRLCRILELHADPHPRLLDLLWGVVQLYPQDFTPELRLRVLEMISLRLGKYTSPQDATSKTTSQARLIPKRSNTDSTTGPGQTPTYPSLSVALGSTLFPSYSISHPYPAHPQILTWAAQQAHGAFDSTLLATTRWDNLVLLAVCRGPASSLTSGRVRASSVQREGHQGEELELAGEAREEEEDDVPGYGAVDWRSVLALGALEATLGVGPEPARGGAGYRVRTLMAPEAREGIQNLLRPLWQAWKGAQEGVLSTESGKGREVGAEKDTQHRLVISRLVVGSFFRVAGQVRDGPLVEGCHRFCIRHGLFECAPAEAATLGAEADAGRETIEVAQLHAAHVLAAALCQGPVAIWRDVLEASVPTTCRAEVVEVLLRYFIGAGEAIDAYTVYLYAGHHGYLLPVESVRRMSFALVSSRTWHLAVPFLYQSSSMDNRASYYREELLLAILRVFQAERREYVDPALAKTLGDTLWDLYAQHPPPDRHKYPIRFFLPIMIASGHPARVISIAEAIHHHASPTFFTTRFILRLMRTLVRFRHLHLTDRLLPLISSASAPAAADFHRKLTLSLARAGAHAAARRVHNATYPRGSPTVKFRTSREAMVRAVGFRAGRPTMPTALAVIPLLARRPTHVPTITYAVTLLVRARRSYAARKVLERSSAHLDEAARTTLGNTLLHGALTAHHVRNGRLVRHVLHTKALLERTCAFKPDRVTVNVMIKAMLRWRGVFGAEKVKVLFDHLVRCGYPAGVRPGGANGRRSECGEDLLVPFGTPMGAPAFSVPAMEEPISFERHVRPLYKMFVKAFYVRCDSRAAHVVLGILKEEEVAAMRRREDRNRAKKMGLVRKKSRELHRELEDSGGF
ncbi:hypothetical protein H0H81_007692 [Sphagnurus paluster]|uniref:Uncharacterized protein n=1 Tax=Sphagnurus paluster TaxID=117069 RepID=A0A9P7GJD0_9AGAR|nr:hypothetical protein H0H81_007692 [Sphagnurus paluster]